MFAMRDLGKVKNDNGGKGRKKIENMAKLGKKTGGEG